MQTYQDLLAVGENDILRGKFCRKAVNTFMGTVDYKNAKDGEAYYNKHNTTIENFQKFLYTLTGNQVPDIFGANYKLKTTFFRRLVQQQVQYVLGNGVIMSKTSNKEKLGKDFDRRMVTLAKRAMASGRAFGFWNYDHLEVFGYADTPNDPGFVPLYSEEDSKLMAGIRFWFRKIGDDTVFRATLYEVDGYTEYRQVESKDPVVLEPKRAYKQTKLTTAAGGLQGIIDENYTDLPIVCMYANDSHESELVGIRESVDCYDLVKSGFANNIDDFDGLFWIVKNAGGMDDPDMARFLQRMKTVHGANVDGDDVEVTAQTVDVPVEARSTILELLRSDIYEDFQSLDVKSLSAAAKTTQEIQAAYQQMDNKCADFEYEILNTVQKILELAGINDNPTLLWNRVINQAEQTNMVLSAANYLTDDVIIKHLPFLTPEEADQVIKDRAASNVMMFNENDDEDEEEDAIGQTDGDRTEQTDTAD